MEYDGALRPGCPAIHSPPGIYAVFVSIQTLAIFSLSRPGILRAATFEIIYLFEVSFFVARSMIAWRFAIACQFGGLFSSSFPFETRKGSQEIASLLDFISLFSVVSWLSHAICTKIASPVRLWILKFHIPTHSFFKYNHEQKNLHLHVLYTFPDRTHQIFNLVLTFALMHVHAVVPTVFKIMLVSLFPYLVLC